MLSLDPPEGRSLRLCPCLTRTAQPGVGRERAMLTRMLGLQTSLTLRVGACVRVPARHTQPNLKCKGRAMHTCVLDHSQPSPRG